MHRETLEKESRSGLNTSVTAERRRRVVSRIADVVAWRAALVVRAHGLAEARCSPPPEASAATEKYRRTMKRIATVVARLHGMRG